MHTLSTGTLEYLQPPRDANLKQRYISLTKITTPNQKKYEALLSSFNLSYIQIVGGLC